MQYAANAARWGREKMNFPEGIPKMPLIAVQHEKLSAVSMEKVTVKLRERLRNLIEAAEYVAAHIRAHVRSSVANRLRLGQAEA